MKSNALSTIQYYLMYKNKYKYKTNTNTKTEKQCLKYDLKDVKN